MKTDSAETLPRVAGFHPNPRKHMVEGTIRVFLAEALLLPTGLITAAFLTRKLAPEGYGLFAVAASLVAWIEWSITAVFSRAAFKLIGEADDWRPIGGALARIHLVLGGAMALLLCLSAGWIADVLKAPALAGYLRLFAIDIPIFSLAQAHRSILVGIGDFRERAMVTVARWTTRLALIVILVQSGLSIRGAIIGSIGASIIELAVCRFYVQPAIFARSIVSSRQLWDYALPLFFYGASMRLLDKLDLFMLQGLRGNVPEAGMYGAAQNLTLVAGIFALAFVPLLLSTLSRMLHRGDVELARRTARDALRVVIGMLPFAALISGAAEEIAVCVFGEAFRPSAIPIAILVVGSVGLVTISVATAILTAAGMPRLTVLLAAPLVVLSVVGNFWLIPRMGSTGAALVTTFVSMAGGIAAVITLHRIWAVEVPMLTLGRSLLISAACYTLATAWPTSGFWLLTAKLSAIGGLIVLAFVALGEVTASEISAARTLFARRAAMADEPPSA
jgi:O-antigen/teichoic acid export membrane protein